MNLKEGLVAGGVALVVALGSLWVAAPQDGKDGRDGVSFGAVPVINSPVELGTGGTLVGGGKKLIAGTRTLFDIQLPNATTTGTLYCSIQNNETYTVKVRMGWGATVGATTTALSDFQDIPSGVGLDLVASSSDFYAPNSHVVLNIAATTTSVDPGHNPAGGCTFDGVSY